MKPRWIKWYPIQWLHSTARDEMNAAQRSTFQDFVCLAAISFIPGCFKFSSEQGLARMLNTEIEIIQSTIKICLDRKRISLRKDKEGYIIRISKWKIYQPLSPVDSKSLEDANKVNNKQDSSCLLLSSLFLSSLSFNKNLKEWEGIQEEDKKRWREAYPACDIEIELKKMIEWIISNPEKGKKSNWRRFITSWLTRQQDRGGTKGGIQEDKHRAAREGTLKQFRDGEITYEEIVEISKKYNEPLLLEEAEKIRGSKK